MARTSRAKQNKGIQVRMLPATSSPAPIVIASPSYPARPAPAKRRSSPRKAAAPKKRRSPSRRGAGMGARGGGAFGLPSDLISSGAAGLLVGVLKSTGLLEKLPRLPYVGRVGAAAIAAHFIARATGSATARDARNALAVLATYQLGSNSGALSDRIEGDGPEVIDAE